MSKSTHTPQSAGDHQRLRLDQAGRDAARKDMQDGAVTPASGPWREDIVRLLNDALATELVGVLRDRRHHFTADGLASPKFAEEFLVQANAELGHADRLAERTVQLGGSPEFDPSKLGGRSHAEDDEPASLEAMLESNLVAERVACETYQQMIRPAADKDSTTRRLLEDILADEEEHADELKDWLAR